MKYNHVMIVGNVRLGTHGASNAVVNAMSIKAINIVRTEIFVPVDTSVTQVPLSIRGNAIFHSHQ